MILTVLNDSLGRSNIPPEVTPAVPSTVPVCADDPPVADAPADQPSVNIVPTPDVTDVTPVVTHVINEVCDENADVNMAEESVEPSFLDSQGLLVQHPPVTELAARPEGLIALTDSQPSFSCYGWQALQCACHTALNTKKHT